MRISLLFLGLLAVIIFISGCAEQPTSGDGITNFDECTAAGNPVMEYYPRQCRTSDGITFTEEVIEPPMPPEDENVKAVNIAKGAASGLDSTILSNENTTMKVKDTVRRDCPGCWIVELEYSLMEESNRVQKATVKITIDDWKVSDTSYSQITDVAFTPEECVSEGGRAVNTVGGEGCNEDETEIGDVVGFISPNICCVPTKTYCTEEQRGVQACTMEYRPVCGWFDESIQCVKYPCADTYSNPCMACSDEKVEYWTEGECPQ
ncbi:MAG: hypothetical protein JW716_00660 [Candidatus Aenigmarchaeota archaeon]|nr:hypothetical protein [Candidatus Aenigmarchaeota archaeon]